MNSRTIFKFVAEEHESGAKRKLYKTLEKSDWVTKSYPKAWYSRIKGRKAQAELQGTPQKKLGVMNNSLCKMEIKEVIKRGHRQETKVEQHSKSSTADSDKCS